MLGLVLGDALGANTEFSNFNYKKNFITNGFEDISNTKRCRLG